MRQKIWTPNKGLELNLNGNMSPLKEKLLTLKITLQICRVTDCSPHLDGNREWAQRAQYNKFVREWVEDLGQQIFATVLGVGYLAEEAKTHE